MKSTDAIFMEHHARPAELCACLGFNLGMVVRAVMVSTNVDERETLRKQAELYMQKEKEHPGPHALIGEILPHLERVMEYCEDEANDEYEHHATREGALKTRYFFAAMRDYLETASPDSFTQMEESLQKMLDGLYI